MLINNRKAEQAKGTKTELYFGSILDQILNLDTQKKVSESRLMKSVSTATDPKKSTSHSHPSAPTSQAGISILVLLSQA